MISRPQILFAGVIVAGAGLLLTLLWLRKEAAPSAPEGRPLEETTGQIGPRRWTVSRSDREHYLSDPARVNRDLLLQPTMGAGPDEIVDLRIARLGADTPFRAAGFQEGDRILRIDERRIERLSEALNLVHRIHAGVHLSVEVQRGDQVLRFDFDFQ